MLAKRYRLVKDKDFDRVFKKGNYFSNEFIALKAVKNNLKISRFGFIVSLKISKKSIIRHRVRRRIQEIIRLNLLKIKPGFDAIILVRPGIIDKTYSQIERVLINVFKKAGILLDPKDWVATGHNIAQPPRSN